MIGTKILDRYRIDSELGQGGMGTVYKGYDTTLERDIAIKILTESRLGTEGRNRLLQEAKAIAKLSHPNIITVHDAGEYEKSPFIVMEYVAGVNLYEHPPKEIEEIVTITQQVCAALSHAHEHGIIHRDLKPENVILTADGTVKLMDFGLARSVSSRLTSEGTILGTVFYLAPEQAQGRAIDPRSDLYSLGVMLYELTTGELPFLADDPLAVVSQHIHAPVVPPRAKNDHIPPALEALILQLMHKDPADRPASAKEVQDRLSAPEVLDVTAMPAEQLSVLDRIVRGRLVGREQELKQARQMWQQTMAGQGQLLLVSGEPGVGKTRLMREIVTQAEVSGGQAFIGESQEEGNAPYAAFSQIIRRALRGHKNNELDLPNLVLAELISITPELQFDYPSIPPNPTLESESEQRRLFESVFRFVQSLSEQSSLMLVLEDIHWADSGTLSLLNFLTRRCRELPVMVLTTYREMELDEALSINQVLLDLNRRNLGTRLKLERFNESKTRDMLAVIFNEEITPDFLAGIFQETEGNPFFIEEVCKALLDSGQVYYDGERWQRPPDMADMQIPQSIRVAISSRLSKLSEPTKDLLLHASVIGREFDYDLLHRVTEFNEDELIDGLEAAMNAQLISELKEGGGESLLFSHALIPAALRESISGLRRTRLHRKVAQVLEEMMPDAYQRLAFHWGEGGNEKKGLAYTIKAADRAQQTYANEDAIRLYTDVLNLLPKHGEDRFEILAARANIFALLGDRKSQIADCLAMQSLAQDLNKDTLIAKALLYLAEYYGDRNYSESEKIFNQLETINQSLKDPFIKANTLMLSGDLKRTIGNLQASNEDLETACDLFEMISAKKELAKSLHMLSMSYSLIGNFSDSMKTANRSVELSREIGDQHQESHAIRRLGIAYCDQGDFVTALKHTKAALKISSEIGDRVGETNALNNLGLYAYTLGDLETSSEYFMQAMEFLNEIGYGGWAVLISYFSYLVYCGLYEQGIQFFEECLYKAKILGDKELEILYEYMIVFCLFHFGQFRQILERLNDGYLKNLEKVQGPGERWRAISIKGLCHLFSDNRELGLDLLEASYSELCNNCGTYSHSVTLLNFSYAKSYLNDEREWKSGLEIIKQLSLPEPIPQAYSGLKSGYLCTIARLYLHLGEFARALDASTELVKAFEKGAIYDEEVFNDLSHYYLLHSQALRATEQEEEADKFLLKAYQRVMMVAGKTMDAELRRSWFENVPWNREVLQEAKVRGIATN